jgi:hypothetical protein
MHSWSWFFSFVQEYVCWWIAKRNANKWVAEALVCILLVFGVEPGRASYRYMGKLSQNLSQNTGTKYFEQNFQDPGLTSRQDLVI